MAKQNEERDVYYIPPNFIDTGTVFGGMFKLRNVIETGVIVGVIALPLFKMSLSLTAKIIIACLTALPLGILALIGINGESLSSFIINFFKFLRKRRVISREGTTTPKREKAIRPKQVKPVVQDFDDKFDDEFNEKPSRKKCAKKKKAASAPKTEDKVNQPSDPVADYLPIKQIKNGIIYADATA